MFGFYPFWDTTYILVIIGAVLSMLASARVKSTFATYDKVRAGSGLTGARAAEMILRNHGIYDIQIQHIRGELTDCYVPGKKILNLSDSTYNSTSIAAIGVAAHECGHAIQHAVGYAPLTLSNMIPCNADTYLGYNNERPLPHGSGNIALPFGGHTSGHHASCGVQRLQQGFGDPRGIRYAQ